MIYDGKTYRNLESQVGYLTDVAEALDARITEVAANIPSKMIVEELPEEGDPNITYYVGPKGTEPNLYYEVWVWVQEEPDGPFVWRELEDTDQVDLSGYLPKVTGDTTYAQVYVKNADGTQGMVDAVNDNYTANSIARRDSGGRIKAENPVSWNDVVIKDYAENNFVAKDTSTTPYSKAYIKKTDGTQDTLSMASTPNTGFIVQYAAGGQLSVPYTPTAATNATSKDYVDSNFLAKQTTTSTYYQVYGKNADGTQAMYNVNVGVLAGAIPMRRTNGNIAVPTTPTEAGDAASKAYVDAAVGQLLYLHDIDLAITIDSTNKLFIKAYLVNGSATAITTFDRIVYKRLDVQWGGFGPSSDNATPSAITKLPDGFRQDEFEEPMVGFLYQYFSGGNLVSANTTSSMTTTITDVVTTW